MDRQTRENLSSGSATQSPKSKLSASQDSYVWVTFQAYKIESQSIGQQRGAFMTTSRVGGPIKLMLPREFMYAHNHTWEDYESMASRMLGKLAGFSKLYEEVKYIPKAAREAAKQAGQDMVSGKIGKNTMKGAVVGAQNTLASANVVYNKVDMPLVYNNSERRKFSFDFELTATTDPKSEVLDIVRTFEYYAAPESKGQLYIDPPYIFNIRTEPGDLVNYDRAALTNVSSSFNSPYDENGNPFYCKLTLQFEDMSPLYKRTILQGGFVTSSTK